MVTMYRRKNGVFYLKFKGADGKEVRVSTGVSVKREAAKFKRRLEENLIAHSMQSPGSDVLGFDEAWEYYEAALKPLKKPRTLYNEQIAWNQFKIWCQGKGVRSLGALKVGDVAMWQAELLGLGRSPVGVNTYLRMCKLVIQHLIRLERVTFDNPFRQVRQIREVRSVKYIDWPDIVRLVDTAKAVSRDIHLVFILGAYGGLRKAEILSVRWEHVEWDKGQLLVEGTKSTASRNYIPLHQALHDALLPYWPVELTTNGTNTTKKEEGTTPWIVAPWAQPSEAVNAYRWNWRKQWAKVEALEVAAAAEEGRDPIHATPHQLRHSVATHLLDCGYTIQQVAVFLRHANDVPTRRYADLKGVELQIDKF